MPTHSTNPMFEGASLTFSEFESEVWRNKPLMLGSMNTTMLSQLSFNELLKLCQNEQVESRLLAKQRDSQSPFQLEFGPFEASDLESELKRAGMVMLQNLESFLPEVSAWLSDQFGFLPRWRIEDVMATLAHRGGNCGAHFDQYDVFLVQLSGQKLWQLDAGGHTATDLSEASDIRLLNAFEAVSEHTLGPGDVLYVPPGVGHFGVAGDDCITLSVGVRNPLLSEMAAYLADMLLQESDSEVSLNDRLGGLQIREDEVQELSQQVVRAIGDAGLTNQWYGRYMTEPRDPELITHPDSELSLTELTEVLSTKESIQLTLPARIAVQSGQLFINGESLQVNFDPKWLEVLQQKRSVSTHAIATSDLAIVQALVYSGAVIL